MSSQAQAACRLLSCCVADPRLCIPVSLGFTLRLAFVFAVSPNTDLQGAEHLGDLAFLFVDTEDIFEDDGAAFVTAVNDEAPGAEQDVFEQVGDFLVDTEIGGIEAFEVGEETVVVQQFVAADFPIINAAADKNGNEEHQHDRGEDHVEGNIRQGLDRKYALQEGWSEVFVEGEQKESGEADSGDGEEPRE